MGHRSIGCNQGRRDIPGAIADATWLGFTPAGGTEQLWLFASDGSWSMLDDDTMRVEQYGPRNLWDEIEAAYTVA